MIPKKIHYCWFGGNPLPELAQKCIASWKQYCPDYEIIEWNENNFDVNCCRYTAEAYAEKKWAFVSDYARFYILYREGGVYFDTDVELLRPIDDLLEKGAFLGCEQGLEGVNGIAPGLGLAVEAGHKIYKEMLEFYEKREFLKRDGTPDTTTVVQYTTEVMKKHGWENTDAYQLVEGIHVYPSDFFCPINYFTSEVNITANTRSIHHYTASWIKRTFKVKMKRYITKFLGPRMMQKLLVWKKYWHEGI